MSMFGKQVDPQNPPHGGCTCDCHTSPPGTVMHCMPCCTARDDVISIPWNTMESAPKDGTLIILLCSGGAFNTEDDHTWRSIGAWQEDDSKEEDGSWQIAGWCWTHDHFTQAAPLDDAEDEPELLGWLPLPEKES